MYGQYTPYVLLLFIAAAVQTAFALVAWRRRPASGAIPFALLMLAMAEWSLGYALELASDDLLLKIIWHKIRFLGLVTVPSAWLIFALQYAGWDKWLTRRNLAALTIVPVVTLLLLWTNEIHHRFYSNIELVTVGLREASKLEMTNGPWFYVHAVYSYLLVLLGTLLLLQTFLRSRHLYRGQAGVVLIGVFMVWVANAIDNSGLAPFRYTILTPLAFDLAGLAVAWSLFRFRLFDIVPVARYAIIEGMSDGVIVLDAQNRIVDLNPAAQQAIGHTAAGAIGQPAAQGLSRWPDLVERYRDAQEVHTEIDLADTPSGAQRTFDLRISPLYGWRGDFEGRLIVLHDITKRKRIEDDLRAQKQLFENLVAIARATTERPMLEATLQNTLDVAATLTGAQNGSLFLLDKTGAATHSIVMRSQGTSELAPGIVARLMSHGLVGWIARHRQAVLIADTSCDERWLTTSFMPQTIRSALGVPILSGSVLAGILTLGHSQPGHFELEHLHLMQAAADQMALVMHNAQMFDAQRRMADRQMTLYEALRAVSGQLDPDAVARLAVEAVVKFTGWPHVLIAVPDPEEMHWVIRAASGALATLWGATRLINQGVVGRTLRTAQTQLVPDVRADPDFIAAHPVLRSELAVPLRRGERVFGVLNLESDRLADFDADDVLLAESLAEAIALALENARLYEAAQHELVERKRAEEALQQRNRDLALHNQVSQTLTATLDLRQVTERLIGAVTETVGAEGGTVWLWNAERADELICQAASHPGLDHPLVNLRLRPGQGVAGWVAQRRESALVLNTQDDPRFYSGVDTRTGFRTTSLLAVPLRVRDTVIGVLEVVNKLNGKFDAHDLALVETLAASAAIAIDNARLVETLRQQAAELQAHNEELDAFAHTVAHDLKNPLGNIVGYTGVLEQDYATMSDEERQMCVRAIVHGGQKMTNIIDELLLLAGVRKMEVEIKPLDMGSIVAEATERLAHMIQEHQAEISVPAAWPAALGYAPWVVEVWVNYLSNALRYGGRPPRVALGGEAQPDGRARFWVRDNGNGIAPDVQTRLFTPFTQLTQAHATGYGLGLSIVRRIVEKLSGQVAVASDGVPGRGSIFYFTLPTPALNTSSSETRPVGASLTSQ